MIRTVVLSSMLRRKIMENAEPATKRLKSDDTATPSSIADKILQRQLELNKTLQTLNFLVDPVKYVYNPLEYAFGPNETYVRTYCDSRKKLLFVGMNPGPFGMCQTGVPFGDPTRVREFLKIEEEVGKPEAECPERPINGFASKKKEVSGDRLWGFFSELCGSPEVFFKHSFVFNFCPLAFMKGNGANVTPNEIKNVQLRESLEEACNSCYLDLIRTLKPEIVIAIGIYIEKKTKDLFKANLIDDVKVLYMPHPSPRAANNQNWHDKAQDSVLTEGEKFFMDEAFLYAKKALDAQEVPVGCIFVYKNDVIAVGGNTVNATKNATRHAEFNCFDKVFEYSEENCLDVKAVFQNINVYVTVEPCIMCSAALYDFKVKSIVYGCKNDRFGGSTVFDVSKVLSNGVTVIKGGYRADEAMALLKEFYKGTNPSAPPKAQKFVAPS